MSIKKKKYMITVSVMIAATVAMFLKIQIQQTWVELMKWSLGFICVGFSVKKITDIYKR